ncbi:MAG: cell division protein FtsQ/DivIB [Rhodoferax sp.]
MNPAQVIPADIKVMNLTALVLLLVFVVYGVVAASRWLVRLPAFDIQAIAVAGDVNHNNALTLRANVAPRLSGTFFSVDLARARAAFEAVPWLRRAVVRRDFPNRLRVDLQEHQAVAYWGDESESRLLNSYGEVFEANTGEVEQDALPRLDGPDGQSAEVLAMYRALEPLFEQLELPIDQLELSGGGSWRVWLDSGATVEIGRGRPDEILQRAQRFLKTLTQVTARYGRRVNAIESADLRHESGYAIRLRGVSTSALVVPTKK